MGQKAFDYWDNVSQVGTWLALPPKTSDAIVAVYVKAFDETMADPAYQAIAMKIVPDAPIARKADLENLVNRLAEVSPAVLKYIDDELARQGMTGGKKKKKK